MEATLIVFFQEQCRPKWSQALSDMLCRLESTGLSIPKPVLDCMLIFSSAFQDEIHLSQVPSSAPCCPFGGQNPPHCLTVGDEGDLDAVTDAVLERNELSQRPCPRAR